MFRCGPFVRDELIITRQCALEMSVVKGPMAVINYTTFYDWNRIAFMSVVEHVGGLVAHSIGTIIIT